MSTVSPLPVVVQSSVDWLTMSTHDQGGYAALLKWRDARFAVLEEAGYVEKRWSAHGYQYRSRGQVAVGVGRRDAVLQLSGGEAQAGYHDCGKWATNVSRVDLEVTGRYDDDRPGLAEEEYRAAGERKRGRGRAAALTLILSEDRGNTLYVGSRKSDQLGRLYDKARESGEEGYANCWRWEVQYRRAYALLALRSLMAATEAQGSIQATVASWFRDRGIGAAFAVTGGALDCRPDRKVPDDERWLTWARRSVRPRAMKLAERYGWRYVAETLVGRIRSYEDWESLLQGIEIELEECED